MFPDAAQHGSVTTKYGDEAGIVFTDTWSCVLDPSLGFRVVRVCLEMKGHSLQAALSIGAGNGRAIQAVTLNVIQDPSGHEGVHIFIPAQGVSDGGAGADFLQRKKFGVGW